MNEELKLIIEMLSGLGSGATQAFIWFLCYKLLEIVFVFIGLLSIIFLVESVIFKTFGMGNLGIEIRTLLDIGAPGALTEREQKEIITKIKNLLKNEHTK